MRRLIFLLAALIGLASPASAQVIVLASCGTVPAAVATLTPGNAGMYFIDNTGKLCINGTFSASITFPTIGAAVPATADYIALNNGGNLVGLTGVTRGGQNAASVQVVDAAGNQITSFGGNSTIVSPVGAGTSAAAVRTTTASDDPLLAAVQAAIPAGPNRIGYVSDDPCTQLTKTSSPISQNTSSRMFLASTSNKNYICSINIIGSDAENVSVVEGTGSICGSSTAAVIGGTTAALGLNLAANGGIAWGNGGATIAKGFTAATDLCLLQSGSGRVSGAITIIQVP